MAPSDTMMQRTPKKMTSDDPTDLGITMRIPERLRPAFAALLRAEDRPKTLVVLRALAVYAAYCGHSWPDPPQPSPIGAKIVKK